MAACMRWEVMTAPHISQQWRNMTPRYTAVKFIIRKTRLLPGLSRLDAVDRVKRYKWICCVNMCSVSWLAEQSNTWTAIANMLSRRSSAGVAVLDGMLYVAGGNDGTSCLNSVERFNPKTNTWEGVAAMNIRRLATFTKRTEVMVCFFYIMLHRKRQKEKRWEKNLGWIQGNKLNTPLANWASRMTQFSLYACITSAGSEEYGNSLCGFFLFWFF